MVTIGLDLSFGTSDLYKQRCLENIISYTNPLENEMVDSIIKLLLKRQWNTLITYLLKIVQYNLARLLLSKILLKVNHSSNLLKFWMLNTNQYWTCVVAHNYRYARACVSIQCTVELGVAQSENIKGVQMREIVMNGSTMTLHNMITLKAFGHALVFSIWFYDDATQYENTRNVLDTYLR